MSQNQNLFNALDSLGVIANKDEMKMILHAIELDKEAELLSQLFCKECRAFTSADCNCR